MKHLIITLLLMLAVPCLSRAELTMTPADTTRAAKIAKEALNQIK